MMPYFHKKIQQQMLLNNQTMVRLLNCWFVHKSNEFLNWMKNKHSNILLIFVLANYICASQLAYVILQCPLKHAFKMVFNGWTTNVIKSQIDTCANPHVDFRMNNLKPKMGG